MGQEIGEKKQSIMEHIIDDHLKPNSYVDEHPIWERLEKALGKMTYQGINDLWTVLTCVRHDNMKAVADARSYPYIRAWGKLLTSNDYYINEQVELARLENAPATALRKGTQSGKWQTIADFPAGKTKNLIEEFAEEIRNNPDPSASAGAKGE